MEEMHIQPQIAVEEKQYQKLCTKGLDLKKSKQDPLLRYNWEIFV